MECSPLIAEEIARAQSEAQRHQYREKAFQQDWTSRVQQNFGEVQKLRCDSCGGSTPGGKFCQHCGQGLIKEVHCRQCGTKGSPGAMFCAQCGTQL